MHIHMTPALRRYLVKLLFRIALFGSVLLLYLRHKELIMQFMTQTITRGISIIHVLWIVFMVVMLSHLFPRDRLSMALLKGKEENYREVPGYQRLELLEYVQSMNNKAWRVMLVWLVFNGIWGLLYLVGVVDTADLLMLTVFYFLSDYICILFFCPFQNMIMGNKSSINCRINDWAHFMMFTPMLFIKNFFSWSLFFTSCVVLIHWELVYAKHPERFWEGSNQTLRCQNCQDKTCQIKSGLRMGKREGDC